MTERTAHMPAPDLQPLEYAAPVQPAPKRFGSWLGWKGLAGALVIGLLVGGGIGVAVVTATTDPTQSEEYVALDGQLTTAHEQISAAEKSAQDAAADARRIQGEVAKHQSELDQREQALTAKDAAVTAREAAVTAAEQQIAANSIREGTWTVGRDIEPGTYRTAEAVTGQCYWAIYRSGTNGSDIVDNDIVNGGYPSVQLSEGQDFKNRGCGTFVKQ